MAKVKTDVKKFNVWKANSNGEPIEGTDRTITGPCKRDILGFLAYEEGVDHLRSNMVVKLPNGDYWCASQM